MTSDNNAGFHCSSGGWSFCRLCVSQHNKKKRKRKISHGAADKCIFMKRLASLDWDGKNTSQGIMLLSLWSPRLFKAAVCQLWRVTGEQWRFGTCAAPYCIWRCLSFTPEPPRNLQLRQLRRLYFCPPSCFTDPSGELRLHGSRAQRQHPLRLLLQSGSSGHLPGPGHGGHRQSHALELRVHRSFWGKLRRERRGCVHSEVAGGRWVPEAKTVFCPSAKCPGNWLWYWRSRLMCHWLISE